MSTTNPRGPFTGPPEYALAVSLIFTKATSQAIILNEPPTHVCSTSILWNSLVHDKRFEQIPMTEALPGDIIIEPGWLKTQPISNGYAGIVVDHQRIVSNSTQGVQNDRSLLELQHHPPEMAAYRYVGFRNYYQTKPLANAAFDPNEVSSSCRPAGRRAMDFGGCRIGL